MLSTEQGTTLLRIARGALREALLNEPFVLPDDAFLQAPGATFVTLRRGEHLRGCIGSLTAHQPLGADVRKNALASAFDDPRFGPLDARELDQIAIEVTVLSPLEALDVRSEEETLAALRPGKDGVVLRKGRAGGTFIPQMWEVLPDPKLFLRELKRKAGFPEHGWSSDIRVSRFTAEAVHEPGYQRKGD